MLCLSCLTGLPACQYWTDASYLAAAEEACGFTCGESSNSKKTDPNYSSTELIIGGCILASSLVLCCVCYDRWSKCVIARAERKFDKEKKRRASNGFG